jgi:hypothetical protein
MTPIMAFAEEARIRGLNAFQGDPILRFRDSMKSVAITLERRTDEELEEDGRNNPDPVLREHALYQLITRRGQHAVGAAEAALLDDPDAQLRINVLWLLEKCASHDARRLGLALLDDDDPRVREWTRVFAWEMQWTPHDFRVPREAKYHENRTFDETLFLHIQCHLYVRLRPSNDLWGHIILSPQMLARVYGQALACPVTETRERELVIAKTLHGLHEDGTDHYESFLFRGFTDRSGPYSGKFYFEANTLRPFYKSGRADDASEGVVENVPIPFAREGEWFLNPHLKIKDEFAIEYVRGLFQGWAYVNVDRVMESGGDLLFPGNSVLSTLHHPEVGPMTNAFVAGSFKGKVLDWDGDGVLDLNYLPAHATRQGEVDSDLDGCPDVPGRTVCPRPLRASV